MEDFIFVTLHEVVSELFYLKEVIIKFVWTGRKQVVGFISVNVRAIRNFKMNEKQGYQVLFLLLVCKNTPKLVEVQFNVILRC